MQRELAAHPALTELAPHHLVVSALLIFGPGLIYSSLISCFKGPASHCCSSGKPRKRGGLPDTSRRRLELLNSCFITCCHLEGWHLLSLRPKTRGWADVCLDLFAVLGERVSITSSPESRPVREFAPNKRLIQRAGYQSSKTVGEGCQWMTMDQKDQDCSFFLQASVGVWKQGSRPVSTPPGIAMLFPDPLATMLL